MIGLKLPHKADIRELETVRLLADVPSESGPLPEGSIGAVVHRYEKGKAFEVEFLEPFHAVVTVRAEQLAAQRG